MAISPLLRKLRYEDGAHIYVMNSPPEFEQELATLPPTVLRSVRLEKRVNLVHAFFTLRRELVENVARFTLLPPDGVLLLSYPRGGNLGSDLTTEIIRNAVAPHGIETLATTRLDAVWSAIRCKISRSAGR